MFLTDYGQGRYDNDALNTFYLWSYGVRHMVKNHSDSERKPAAPTWATLSDYQQGFFYMHWLWSRLITTILVLVPDSHLFVSEILGKT